MLLGAKQLTFTDDARGAGAREYIKAGLIGMWDGIENTGFGKHSGSALKWKNLAPTGSIYDATRSQGSFSFNAANFTRQPSEAEVFAVPGYFMRDGMQGEWTYEIGFRPREGWFNNYSGVWGNYGSGKGIVGGQYENGIISFTAYIPDVPLWKPAASEFTAGGTYVVVQRASNSTHTSETWKDGALVAHSTNVDVALSFNLDKTMIGASYSTSASASSTDRTFDGDILFLRVYNRALSDEEIAANRLVDIKRYGIEWGGTSSLPDGYRRIRWVDTDWHNSSISGSHAAYINTGITGLVRNTVSVRTQCVRTKLAGDWNFLYGAEASDNANGYIKLRLFGGSGDWEHNAYSTASTPCPLDVIQDVVVANGKTSINGVSWELTGSAVQQSSPLYIGGSAWVSGTRCWPGLIGRMTIGKGSTVVGDFCPCVRVADSVVGFYDRVTQRFFASANPNIPFKEGVLS